MAVQAKCFDNPPDIFKRDVCVNAASKNLAGDLRLLDSRKHQCAVPSCQTLKTLHRLKFQARVNRPCDSRLGRRFSGTVVVERFVTAFDQDGQHRGFHAGDFEWIGVGFKAVGRLSGMTNVGTHRLPVFADCQRCDARGVMEGRLCGHVVDTLDPALKACQIFGSYRIKFDPSIAGGSGAITGIFEGVVICPCN
jgi:hypothetical protein